MTPQFELAWLFKIARNVCYNARASASRRGRLEATRDLDAMQDELPTPDRDVGVAVSDLTAALACIPERQRQALLLREFQGLSYEEIAADLGVTVAAVETLLFRARRSVAGRLERTGVRASALTSVLGFLRWLLPGGAKVAAVAATATLVATPGMHGPAKSLSVPAKTVAPTPTVVAESGARAPVQSPRIVERRTPLAQSPAAKTPAPLVDATEATEAQTATPTASAASDAPPTATPAAAPPAKEAPPVDAPTLTTPEVTVNVPVNVPDVTVADVSLPDVQLPSVELPPLPVALPPVPDVQLP